MDKKGGPRRSSYDEMNGLSPEEFDKLIDYLIDYIERYIDTHFNNLKNYIEGFEESHKNLPEYVERIENRIIELNTKLRNYNGLQDKVENHSKEIYGIEEREKQSDKTTTESRHWIYLAIVIISVAGNLLTSILHLFL